MRKPPTPDPRTAGYAAGHRDIHSMCQEQRLTYTGAQLIDWFAGWQAGQAAAVAERGAWAMRYPQHTETSDAA